MAELMPAAHPAAPLPTTNDIERVQALTHEPFVLDGEDVATALVVGSARRAAFDEVLAEIEAGAMRPSFQWRHAWSLLLGLERLLSLQAPVLVDGTVLSAHQVDALSGTLTALLAAAPAGVGSVPSAPVPEGPLASSAVPGEEELPADLEEEEADEEPQDWADEPNEEGEETAPAGDAQDDPNADKRFWFEHATGAGKTVAALGFVEATRTGGVLILTHRRNLVDQFLGELRDRGYRSRISNPLLKHADGSEPHDPGNGPVTVETYQWYVRHAGNISDAYTVVICDEAHTALGEKTSASIRQWGGPVFIGMTATGALIARHVTDLFPTQTSRFDLAQAARRGVISPLRCVRIPPGPGVRTIAKVPLRRGEVDTEFDQEMLAELLDQQPFNLAIADLYKTRFEGVPGVIYAAGVRHAYNVAAAFRDLGMKARAVSGETPKRELAETLAAYERGDVDVLVNAQLLAEGWNSPRATVCMHLAPTASKRIYQQRVGRVTRRHPGKESGIVVDFVAPETRNDDPAITLHSLLDRDVYRGGAIVIGPVRRGRGRRLRVERRVLPVCAEADRRIEVFERELWRIAVERLEFGEQIQWAALAGARVSVNGWRRARAMLHFDTGGDLRRAFLLTAIDRNPSSQLTLRALQEVAGSKDPEAFDAGLDMLANWPREERSEGVKLVLGALAERKIGRRDQANNWIWRCAEYTREIHEEYAIGRWPETKRLLGLLVNSSGSAHARNARKLVQASRQQERRLSAALLAAALPHTAEAGEVVNGARTRMSRKPAALARDLLRNFPKAGGGKGAATGRRRKRQGGEDVEEIETTQLDDSATDALDAQYAAEPDELSDGEAHGDGGEAGANGDGDGGEVEARREGGAGLVRVVIQDADEFESYSPEVTASDVDPPPRSRRGRGSRTRRRVRGGPNGNGGAGGSGAGGAGGSGAGGAGGPGRAAKAAPAEGGGAPAGGGARSKSGRRGRSRNRNKSAQGQPSSAETTQDPSAAKGASQAGGPTKSSRAGRRKRAGAAASAPSKPAQAPTPPERGPMPAKPIASKRSSRAKVPVSARKPVPVAPPSADGPKPAAAKRPATPKAPTTSAPAVKSVASAKPSPAAPAKAASAKPARRTPAKPAAARAAAKPAATRAKPTRAKAPAKPVATTATAAKAPAKPAAATRTATRAPAKPTAAKAPAKPAAARARATKAPARATAAKPTPAKAPAKPAAAKPTAAKPTPAKAPAKPAATRAKPAAGPKATTAKPPAKPRAKPPATPVPPRDGA